jgi:hypothetical protein
MSDEQDIRARVEAATVRLPGLDGQGVLVRGGYMLTAAHCVEWSGEGGMALGGRFMELVEARGGRTFRASGVGVEPVADVAALGPADDQELAEDAKAFQAFVGEVEGVPRFTGTFEVERPTPIQLLTHRGGWIRGTITRYSFPGAPPDG